MAKTKKKRTLSKEQIEKMQAGRKAKAAAAPVAPPADDDFKPTEVAEKELAEKAKADAGLAQPGNDGLAAPEPLANAEQTTVRTTDNQPTSHAPQPSVAIDPNLVATIAVAVAEAMRQNPQVAQASPEQKLEELEANTQTRGSQPHAARLGAGGEVQGIVYKYEINKNYYPDPTSRLLDEKKLARFAMHENFIFRWEVDGVEYKKNNITYTEPRFTLELFRKLYNEEGDPTGKAALVARQMLHEDEFTTRIMAMKLGIIDQFEDSEEGFRALMNEIRYQRFQQWLFAIFTPPKITTFRKRPVTQVIDGKAVEVYDTETLTDHDRAVSQTASLRSQDGVGSVAIPE